MKITFPWVTKKRVAVAVGIALVALVILGNRPARMQDIYAEAKPACTPTKGTIAHPGKAINIWPVGYENDAFIGPLRVDWIRNEFNWAVIQPKPEEYVWDNYDFIMREARKGNIQVLGLLSYSARWANSHGDEFYPPKNLEDYANYLRAVVSRYKPYGTFAKQEGWTDGYGVTHWEVWNEPNLHWFWKPLPNPNDYVEMLHQANVAIRKADPYAVILHGSLSPSEDPGLSFPAFMETLYASGAKDCFDVVNLHPYLFAGEPPSEMNRVYIRPVRDVMKKYGDDKKPIWATEFGYIAGEDGWVSEETQAQYVKEAYREVSKGTIQALFWFALGSYREEKFGLYREDMTKRPSYDMFRNLDF